MGKMSVFGFGRNQGETMVAEPEALEEINPEAEARPLTLEELKAASDKALARLRDAAYTMPRAPLNEGSKLIHLFNLMYDDRVAFEAYTAAKDEHERQKEALVQANQQRPAWFAGAIGMLATLGGLIVH